MPIVLDSWAIFELLDGNEPAASRVQAAIDSGQAVMSWINVGEVAYLTRRRRSARDAEEVIRDLDAAITLQLPDRALILEAAAIKASHAMSYADSFAAATAVRLGAELYTGDPELLVEGAEWQSFDPSGEYPTGFA